MTSIGIVGSGIAGLHLRPLPARSRHPRHYLQRPHARQRSAWDGCPTPSPGSHRDRDRALGVDHWDIPDYAMFCAHFRINGDPH
ncbi:MAG: hypothetical protein U0232_21470 [Thermomicrobiales bacterium]